MRALVRPGDITSAGWHAAQGFSAFLKAVVHTSTLGPLPRGLAFLFAMAPLVGWLVLPGRTGLFSHAAARLLAAVVGYPPAAGAVCPGLRHDFLIAHPARLARMLAAPRASG